MVNTNFLKRRIKELGLTQKDLADGIGMDLPILRAKLSDTTGREIKVKEANAMVEFLNIEDPGRYFFK